MQRKKPKAKVPASPPATVDREAVTRLAYELYVRRGGEPGHDVKDWLLAERILLEEQKRTNHRRRLEDSFRFA